MNQLRKSPLNPSAIVAAAAMAAGSTFAALPAWAQPAAAQSASLPSYASGEESIRGRITSFDGKYGLQVRDERGFVDDVRLHAGTVINPTGLRLSPGQSVTVLGHNAGKRFEANEIDTPYASVPGFGYAYPGYAYPAYGYPVYGYPYGYYGYRPYPAFGVGFRSRGFGFGGWF